MNNAFKTPIKEIDIYEEIEKSLREPGVTDIDGVAEAAKAHFIYSFGGDERVKLIIKSDDTGARELLKEMRLYDRDAVYYPPRDLIFYQSDLNGNELTRERMNCVKTLSEKKGAIFITTFDALMEKIPGLERIRESVLFLTSGEDIETEAFSKKLVSMGYRRRVQAENPGEFAVRGGIFDVFPLTEENPVRFELWGDTIDS
ncbi:MAG: transcription-repair coupling factor, partial [Lachnospiraceae bacterium]|nr:transcription-repair coupling factor [Lachnospiraceae bacterium]